MTPEEYQVYLILKANEAIKIAVWSVIVSFVLLFIVLFIVLLIELWFIRLRCL